MKNKELPDKASNHFKVPENYFETLESRVMSSINSLEEGELPVAKGAHGFKVPEGYFTNLEDRLMEKAQKPSRASKVISLFNKESLYYAAGVAAVFVAIVSNFFLQQPDAFSLENMDLMALEHYIDESIDFSTPEVSNMVSEGDFNHAPSSPPNYIDQEAVLEYLHDNMEEPALIFNDD